MGGMGSTVEEYRAYERPTRKSNGSSKRFILRINSFFERISNSIPIEFIACSKLISEYPPRRK